PMLQYGKDPLSFVSLSIALIFGAAGLPHVLMRFYTVPTAKEARRSVSWAIGLIGAFYLFTLILGYGAAVFVGKDAILGAPGGVNSAAPALAYHLGGEILLGVIAGVAFATILAVVAGLTITAAASFAHDIYNSVLKNGEATPEKEVQVARTTAIVIGVISIIGGIAANGQNVAFLVSLAFAVAASANLPSILYSLYWKRFNTRGSVWSIYGGLISAVGLIAFSPVVSGLKTSMFPAVNFAWFPLTNPALISVPLGFFLGWLGTVTSKEFDAAKQAEMEVRSMTGAGAEKAVTH
ncbi:MAG: cation acetate symporter, partial [Propionibacteriaceae bacterium]|nr:cation acetate symporter [Propionibacteriaceae bacterium]